MTPQFAAELLSTLKQNALGLDELHERVRLSGSNWSRDQLELFLISLPNTTRDDSHRYRIEGNTQEEELQTAIIASVHSFSGVPITAAQLRSRLPSTFITTDESILAVARRTAELEVFGPNLIRIAK
jgi:hypothetical protein